MRAKKLSIGLSAVFAISTVTPFILGTYATAQTEKVLHNFKLGAKPGGSGPEGNLIFDAAGNLYGTTFCGGTHANDDCANEYQGYGIDGSGTVFELIPQSGGKWTEKVLHNFGSAEDGAGPDAAMIFDAAGNLYGTTLQGGTNGDGTVYELMPKADGSWTEKVLYSFCSQSNCADGSQPFAPLVFDHAGNLYGTTYLGGRAYEGLGTVFELSPEADGKWTEKVLHIFAGAPGDGANPQAGLVLDASGNLYGTTPIGGSNNCDYKAGCGTVFELSLNASVGWTEALLYVFEGSEDSFGAEPNSTLIFDSAGNLYGTTSGGPAFELLPQAGGGWAFAGLPICCGSNGVTVDAAGNLYGTIWADDGGRCCGRAWKLSPETGGSWATTVYTFPYDGEDGAFPLSGFIRDAAGNLYGATADGGSFWGQNYGEPAGTVFEITF
ncbi:MAG: choice-of-anchor tandem repeat GloVer-containing protein [Candidatus Sulfotelmatobacter sp.]